MAQTELKRIEQAIRLGMEKSPSLGCGFVAVAGGDTAPVGDYVAVQTMHPDNDTVLSDITGDSGTGLTIPSEAVGTTVYMNFSVLTTSRAVICYHRCK